MPYVLFVGALPLVNRVRPVLLGLPFLFVRLLGAMLLGATLLTPLVVWLARRGDRSERRRRHLDPRPVHALPWAGATTTARPCCMWWCTCPAATPPVASSFLRPIPPARRILYNGWKVSRRYSGSRARKRGGSTWTAAGCRDGCNPPCSRCSCSSRS
ncbi:DUF3311 domain-containing protein [Streptomyces sp. NPDC051098]|uniref:DUF3311 domain-containing protein n=1 Tax=Streptomyces sp. NPDC051098 TaxID=3155411 RepID=UPI00343E7DAB